MVDIVGNAARCHPVYPELWAEGEEDKWQTQTFSAFCIADKK